MWQKCRDIFVATLSLAPGWTYLLGGLVIISAAVLLR